MTFLNLQHTRSDGEIDTYYLKGGRPYRVGRGSTCEIRILDVRMSRQHAAIEEDAEGWLFTDISSTNPAKINDQIADGACRLAPGDTIRLGRTTLTVATVSDHLTAPAPTVKPELRQHTEDGPRAGTAAIRHGNDVLAQTDRYMAGEARALYIKLLGKKVGPLTRKEAREFKKRELKGTLQESDIQALICDG